METSTNGSNGQSQAADPHLQEVIRSAERELHELLERRAELMKRIGTIKQTLAGLANIFGDGVLSDQLLGFLDRKSASRQPGFTRACRVVLMDSKRPLGARLVCQPVQHCRHRRDRVLVAFQHLRKLLLQRLADQPGAERPVCIHEHHPTGARETWLPAG